MLDTLCLMTRMRVARLFGRVTATVKPLESGGYKQGYLGDESAPETVAYWRFWNEVSIFKQSGRDMTVQADLRRKSLP